MKTIGVCLVFNDSDDIEKVKLFLSHLFTSVNYGMVNYYIVFNGSKNEFTEYFETLVNTMPFTNDDNEKDRHFVNIEYQNLGLYESYNHLMKIVKEDYICLIPNGVYVNNNWHLTMLNYYSKLSTSGIISINSGLEKTYYSSLLSDEEMVTICMPENYTISGIYFMSKSLVHFMGGFDCTLKGYEREELCGRSRANGYVNYYALKENCIDTLYTYEEKTNEAKLLYDSSLKTMIKNKTFKKTF
jgi:hypothetical protein